MEQNKNTIKNHIRAVCLIAFFLGTASAIGYFFDKMGFPETNVVIIYILSVLLAARLTQGFVYGILASVAATFAFNYFFTAPFLSFSVYDPSYLITFVIMTITAIITSALTSRIKQDAVEAEEKEIETRALYQLTNLLTDAKDICGIAGIATRMISEVMGCKAACLCFDENNNPEPFFIQQVSKEKQINRTVENVADTKHRVKKLQSDYDIGSEFYDWPIKGQESTLGIIRIPAENAQLMKDSQASLLQSMIESTALAMDRLRQAQQRIKSNEDMVQERYRGNLLRAISHDLRTPLSGIMGTSEMLMDMTEEDDPRYGLSKGIYQDADWLRSLVENILNLTRLQEGKLVINKEQEAVEEIVGSAVNHMQKRSPEYDITVKVPNELILVPMDAKLIQQVLINLLDNAVKHTPSANEIIISVEKTSHMIEFSVIDGGDGIAETDLPNIFQMFYTSCTRRADVKHGIGLGLTICEAIVKAHEGKIDARNRIDKKGAIFSFTIPLEEEKESNE